MLTATDFDGLSYAEKLEYITPLFLQLPESFVQSKVVFSYISRGKPSEGFLRAAYNQLLGYIKDGKTSLETVSSQHISETVQFMKKLSVLEATDKESAESFLVDGLSSL